MSIEEQPDEGRTVINFTSIHLAKSSGEALHHSYQGQFDFKYTDRDSVFHGSWNR